MSTFLTCLRQKFKLKIENYGLPNVTYTILVWLISHTNIPILYKSPILGKILDLISPDKINLFEPRFKSYDPWNMANWSFSLSKKIFLLKMSKKSGL